MQRVSVVIQRGLYSLFFLYLTYISSDNNNKLEDLSHIL